MRVKRQKIKHLTIIKSDGTVETRTSPAELPELQEIVGGYIQLIPAFTHRRHTCGG